MGEHTKFQSVPCEGRWCTAVQESFSIGLVTHLSMSEIVSDTVYFYLLPGSHTFTSYQHRVCKVHTTIEPGTECKRNNSSCILHHVLRLTMNELLSHCCTGCKITCWVINSLRWILLQNPFNRSYSQLTFFNFLLNKGKLTKSGYTRVVSEQNRAPFFSRRGALTHVCKTPLKRVLAPEPTTPCVRAAPQTVFSVFDPSKQRQWRRPKSALHERPDFVQEHTGYTLPCASIL